MAHDVDRFLRDLMEMQLELMELSPKAQWVGLSGPEQEEARAVTVTEAENQ